MLTWARVASSINEMHRAQLWMSNAVYCFETTIPVSHNIRDGAVIVNLIGSQHMIANASAGNRASRNASRKNLLRSILETLAKVGRN